MARTKQRARRAWWGGRGRGGRHRLLRYREGPLHLVLMLGSFALTGYAGLRLLAGAQWPLVVGWFVGAALLHDLVLLPLYALADRAVRGFTAGTARHRAWTRYVRAPVALSGLLLLVWFPLIVRSAGSAGAAGGGSAGYYESATGLPGEVFLSRWLLITAGLFGLSALLLLCRTVQPRLSGRSRPRRSATKQRRVDGR